MGDELRMSEKERRRLVEVVKVIRGEQKGVDGAAKLGISPRQMKRIMARVCAQGDAGLCHRGRGRSSNRAKPLEVRSRALEMWQERLEGWGPTLACEKLAEAGMEVDHETLRRWLIEEGLWKRHRRKKPHRRWRERKVHFGELVQMDGSPHDWLGLGERDCLMMMVDDATSRSMSQLGTEETTRSALGLLRRWVERYGIPCALYTDRHAVYHAEREATPGEIEAERAPRTAFGKVCAKLGIRIILASSPQAKGRIERRHGLYQDRLVKELRFLGIRDMEGANRRIRGGFEADLNDRFTVEAESRVDYHRAVPRTMDLDGVFAFEEERAVSNDWTVRYDTQVYQLTGPGRRLPPAKSHVTVQERMDGSIHMYYRGHEVGFEKITVPPKRAEAKRNAAPKRGTQRRWVPPPDHPWRVYRTGPQAERGEPA